MYADQSTHNLDENSQNTYIFVFCGEQFQSMLKDEAMQKILNSAAVFPGNSKTDFRETSISRGSEPMPNSILPTMVRISEMLCDLGIPTNLLGYEYLRFAINTALTDRDSLYGITKVLYPAVAEEFNTSASRVERAMRHAIEVACNRGDIDVFRKVFGNSISPETGKPTNSEFISKIVDRIKMDDSLVSAVPLCV